MLAEEPSAVRQGVMALAIGLALYAQLAVHKTPEDVVSWLAFAVAAVLAALVAGQRERPAAATLPDGAAWRGSAVRLALGALAVGAIAATTYLSTNRRTPVLALSLWLASPLLATLAVRGWQAAPARRADPPWTGSEFVVLGAVLMIAALARMLWIASLPRAIFGDEPRVGIFLAEAYANGNIPNFFSMGWNTWPVVGLSLQGLFAPLFGLQFWTLRLSSAFLGTLAVLTTYLLARELFAPRTALVAAFLFGICRTAIDFSRLGVAHAQVLCFEPLAFFCLWRALNSGRAVAYLWAGVTTAWCLYSYNAGQLVPPLVFGWLALVALVRPTRVLTHWRGALVLAVAFALTLFPYLYYFTDAFSFGPNWGQWTIMARNRQTLSQVTEAWHNSGLGPAWEILSRQTWRTWLGFNVLPGAGYTLGYRQGGMLDEISAALFVLGLGMSIRRVRRGSDAFLLYWWLGTVFAGGIATIDPPSFVRMVGLLPAIALIAAQPIDWLLRTTSGGIRRMATALLALGLLVGATWDNYRTYFVQYATAPADPMSELRRFAEGLPDNERAVVLGVEHFLQFQGELFHIDLLDQRVRDIAEPAHFLPVHEPMNGPLTVVFGPTQSTLADYVRSLYPEAVFGEATSDGQSFPTVRLTPEQVEQRTGLALSAQRPDGGSSELGRADPFGEHVAAPPDAKRLVWKGSVYWPSDRALPVALDAGQPTTLRVGNAPPITSDGAGPLTATVTLPRGWQSITIEEAVASPRRLAIQLTPNGTVQHLTHWSLRPESARQGLAASYVHADHPDQPSVNAIDPQLNAYAVEDRFPADSDLLMRMPFTATWRGALRVEHGGAYAFEAIGSGPYTVRLDGKELFSASPSMPEQPVRSMADRSLEAGLHPIEVEFDSTHAAHTSRRLFQLFWTPPEGSKELIPPGNFVPPT